MAALSPAPSPSCSPAASLSLLDRAIAAGLALGKAVLICDPTECASQFLSYQSCEMLDCKGLFVLDKLHKRPRDATLADALTEGACIGSAGGDMVAYGTR